MPANTTRYAWVCITNRRYRTEIESSSSDKTYLVKFGPSDGKYQFDWSCECASFQYGNGTDENGYCKHIQKVREEEYCGWNGMFDSGEPEKDENGDRHCPNCGSEVVSEKWTV